MIARTAVAPRPSAAGGTRHGASGRWRKLSAIVGTASALIATGAAPAQGAAPPAPSVIAPYAAVVEVSSGNVLFAKSGNHELGMASTTKLMTALVALDTKPLSTVLTSANYHPSPGETKIGLLPGEKMTLADLVRSMMLPSANDAAETVGERIGGTKAKFVAMMNAKAKALGLTRTHFTNPIGLSSPEHYTTAIELAKIGAAAHANPFIRATVKRPRIALASGDVPRTLINRNDLLGDAVPGGVIDGMKTGHTNEDGYSLVGSATAGGVTVISAVLGEPSEAARDADTARLLRWASQLYVKRTIVHAAQRVATVPVNAGKSTTVSAVTKGALIRIIPRGAKIALKPVSMSPGLDAPVPAGRAVGVAQVLVNGTLVAKVPLVTKSAVEKQSVLATLGDSASDHWKGLFGALLLVVVGTLTVVRARRPGRRTPDRPRRSAASEPTERTTAP